VLLHPHVDVAVLEAARGGILREGLGYDAPTIGVVTNVSADHLGQDGIETVEDLAHLKQVVVEAVRARRRCRAERRRSARGGDGRGHRQRDHLLQPPAASHVIAAHLAAGGRCVLAENDAIVLRHGPVRTELIELSRVAFAGGGVIGFQVENALAATAGPRGEWASTRP
jgi:cyanophycin synthetase